jgi:hypothetical protein
MKQTIMRMKTNLQIVKIKDAMVMTVTVEMEIQITMVKIVKVMFHH